MLNLKEILAQLIAFKSITPTDAGCQDYLIEQLSALGFTCERFNNPPVSNFFARIGNAEPLFVFAGHTDVVPTGDINQWHSNPFELHVENNQAFGRGTADMKGSLAAMLVAAERFLINHPHFTGSLGFLITSGEEGDDFDLGTPHVMAELAKQNIKPAYCVVGEPSSHSHLGDTLKIGRRGSLTGHFVFQGKQGHVAYPYLAENPIHTLAPALSALVLHEWDTGNEHFPPSSLQITHIESGGEANNIIPGELILQLNIRYSTEQTSDKLTQAIQAHFERYQLSPKITWRVNGKPFLTSSGTLITACVDAIKDHTDQTPECSTSGGTSDARFIAPCGVEVVELGPINATIHQVNESVNLDDLDKLSIIYYAIAKKLLL
ncbi:MAG: succinyl-diaminopimelate desuccinylase [Gammaproteobacteria bacterium]|nr:succinyl-diaminopimelate desuccinylase [Gammaproteobacteria bacterium]MCH9717592.1 succinyl-diaminopimelate desuccinylase [Gammaproteobacteria bacterium]MCH9764037.1 succinyl-diaminopimelate desuccinylase [Gammaproteobacteria bacterium]